MRADVDVAIVGNGCLGASIAWELVKRAPALRLALVGPPARPGSASLAAGAMLNVWAELEDHALDDPALQARAEIGRRALALWPAHAAELSDAARSDLLVRWGTYVICSARSPAWERRSFDYLLAALAHAGQPAPLCSGDALSFLDSAPGAHAQRVALLPDGAVDSARLMAALDRVLAGRPACNRIDASVKGLVSAPDAAHRLQLEDGRELRAQTVVLAAGAFTQAIVDGLPELRDQMPPVLFGTGFALDVCFPHEVYLPPALAELEAVVRTLDRGGGCGMHLVPAGAQSRRFYAGASSAVSMQPESRPRLHALATLLTGLADEFHSAFMHAQVSVRPVGYRPVTLDSFPLLGESTVPRLWFCTGTKRDGLTGAPWLARQIAAGVLGERSELPELFRPCRALISYHRRPRAIEHALLGTLGSDTMRGLRMPSHRGDDWFELQRRRIEAVYERRGIEEFGIHPELLHCYDSDTLYQRTARRRDRP